MDEKKRFAKTIFTGQQGSLRKNKISVRHTKMSDKIFSQYVLFRVF